MDFLPKIYEEIRRPSDGFLKDLPCGQCIFKVFHRIESYSGCFPFLLPHNVKEVSFCQRFLTLALKMELEKW